MSRADDLKVAIARNETYLTNKGSLAIYRRLEAQKAELAFIEALHNATPVVHPDWFIDGDPAEVFIIGGSPNNPNGVTWTFGDAVKFWHAAFEASLNISLVRPTLLPGSHVLSPSGYEAAVALGKTSTDFAPEDWNPLGLDIIP